MPAKSQTPPTATERYEEELRLLQADETAIRVLQQRLSEGTRLTAEEESRYVALQSAISHSQDRLPSLLAAKRKERAAIDVTGLVESWQPLMEAKQAEYEKLSQLIRQVWDQVGIIETIHTEQEALLQALPDDQVRQAMLHTFWIDGGTMRLRLAGNLYPPQAWTDFLQNSVGYRVGSGNTIAANDPGCTPIPPRLIDNIVSGNLLAPRSHRNVA